ncbi:hypothetical protein [Ruficoccus sp. ZRK36]|uniref:tetratricopeptide repeat protein n=1 Tax=Ruficoccus sp. ZRK36 TaxID=2866311 RepID=UPI001C72CD37|nr:hypothetical protein [Ruficoccus sp. ZRK36]QYY34630.1 hypothetical protein K0V07_09975 [Ruficoccus sp. ZRK36]
MHFLFLIPFNRLFTFACMCLLVFLAGVTGAQAQNDAAPPEISEKVGRAITKLAPMIEQKQYPQILQTVEPLLAGDDLTPYDRAVLLQIQAQVLLNQGNLTAAITPMEGSLKLSDQHGFFDEALTREFLYFLCQLYYQQSAEATDATTRTAAMDKAYTYLHRWLDALPKRTEESQIFAASLIYARATLDEEHPDMDLIAEADTEAQQGLLLEVEPKEQLYMLLLATAQLKGDWAKMADWLELMVKRRPDNKTYWQQLLGVYLTLAGQSENEARVNDLQLRAILAIERAQAQGFMTEPKDWFNLVGLYLNVKRFGEAATLLQACLDDGRIESSRQNWELLASAWQQAHAPDKAVAALEHAVEVFPQEGQLEYQLAQTLYAQGKPAQAYQHLEVAVRKGNLDTTGQAYLFLCYLDYDKGDFDQAAQWLVAARESGDAAEDEIARLEGAIKDARQTAVQ